MPRQKLPPKRTLRRSDPRLRRRFSRTSFLNRKTGLRFSGGRFSLLFCLKKAVYVKMPDFPVKIQKNSPKFTENPLDALKQLCYNFKLRRDFSANFAMRMSTPETAAKRRPVRPGKTLVFPASARIPTDGKNGFYRNKFPLFRETYRGVPPTIFYRKEFIACLLLISWSSRAEKR